MIRSSVDIDGHASVFRPPFGPPPQTKANQSRRIIISNLKVGAMSLGWGFRSGTQKTISLRATLAVVGLFGLLAARNVPPEFPRTSPPPAATNADSHQSRASHDQRPRFDNDGSQWSAPVSDFRPAPPAAESAHLVPAAPLFYTLQAKGLHYNRPPPVS